MLLGAALRAGTGLQGWGAENATLHRRLQLGKGTAPSPEVFLEPLLSKEEDSSPLLQFMHGLRDSRQILETEILGLYRCSGRRSLSKKLEGR